MSKKIDPIKIREEMVEMHKKYQEHLKTSMQDESYITASWLCYAIFEQRTNRIIEKYLAQCPLKARKKTSSSTCAISTRLKCIKTLNEAGYECFSPFQSDLTQQILDWCKCRNSLIHDLVRIDRYKNYDNKFQQLAEQGEILVNRYYQAADSFREWYQSDENQLPIISDWYCHKKNSQRCIFEDKGC